jgi:hypothetical protein
MAEHRVQLAHFFSRYEDDRRSGTRLRVVAIEAVNMDREVFAYRRIPLQPGDPNDPQQAVFSHVCSPVDLEEFPIGAPLENHVPPWFRLDFVDVLFRSSGEAKASWEDISAAVGVLGVTLTRLDSMDAQPPVWVGDPAPPAYAAAFAESYAQLPVSDGRIHSLPPPSAHGPSTATQPVSLGLFTFTPP